MRRRIVGPVLAVGVPVGVERPAYADNCSGLSDCASGVKIALALLAIVLVVVLVVFGWEFLAAAAAEEAMVAGAAEAAAAEAAEAEAAAAEGAAEGASEGAAEESAAESADDILAELRPGRNSPNLEVDTPEEMQQLFDRLSAEGTPIRGSRYPGDIVELPDGTRVGLRPVSRSGGETIDLFKPDGTHMKVHLP
jgi:type II secretory pathway pseudopilin PulG